VTDGEHSVAVERTPDGHLTCPDAPDIFDAIANGEYYADIIEFVCEYHPELSIDGAYIMDAKGNVLKDD
jgi:hypothetical protein